MWVIEYAWRLLTDKKVRCRQCSAFIGYVCREGHTDWVCAECGNGDIKAV